MSSKDSTSLGRILPAILLIITLLAMPATTVSAQNNQLPFEVTVSLSHIYNAMKYEFLNNYSLRTAIQDENRSIIYMAGTGFAAALNPYEGSVSWTYSLTGTATAMSISGSPGRWMGIGTDAGELVAIDTFNVSNSKYFQGVRGSVTGLEVAGDANGYVLGGVDDQGFLYLYRIGSPYWFEMGPTPDPSVYRSLANYTVMSVNVLENRTSTLSYVKNSSLMLVYAAPQVGGTLMLPTIVGELYYLNGTDIIPASLDPKGIGGSENTNYTVNASYIILIHNNDTGGESYYSSIIELNGTAYPVSYRFHLLPGKYSVSVYLSYAYFNQTSNTTMYYNYSIDSIPLEVKPNNLHVLTSWSTPLNQTTMPPPSLENANSDPYLSIPKGSYYTQFILLNASNAPNIDPNRDLRFLWLPLPLYGGTTGTIDFPGDLRVLAFVSPPQAPPAWSNLSIMPWGPATSLLVIGGDDFVAFYYLNETGGNATFFYQWSFMDGTPYTADVSPDGRMIAVGTSGGLTYLFVWNDTEARYTAAWTYALGEPVDKVRFLHNGTYLLLGGDNGVLQLMNLSINPPVWQPLWRGGPGFNGIISGVSPLAGVLARDTMDYIVIVPAEGSYVTAMKELNPDNPRLYPLLVYSTNYYHYLNGTTTNELALGRNFTLYEDGSPVAFSTVTNITSNLTAALFYVPMGTYNVKTVYSGYGEAYTSVTVSGGGVTTVDLDLHLTEHLIQTIVPEPSDSTDGTRLVAGPLPEVQLSLNASASPQGLIPYDLNAETDAQGQALVWVWSNITYIITASKEYYLQPSPVTLPASPSSSNVTVEMLPVLTDVYLNIVDSDLYSIGQNYPVTGATVVISTNGRNMTLTTDQYGTVHVRLPGGSFTLSINAQYYYVDVERLDIPFSNTPSPVYETILLNPIYYTVSLQALYNPDTTEGFVSGGVPSVTVTAVHQGLTIPPITVVTGPDGNAYLSLRAGNYTLTLSSPYTETTTLPLQVTGDANIQVQLDAKQSSFTLRIIDINYNVPIPGVEVKLTYVGGNSKVFTLENGSLQVSIPYGDYTLEITHPRYIGIQTTLTVDRPSISTSTQLQPRYAYLTIEPQSAENVVNITSAYTVTFPRTPIQQFQVIITPWDDFLSYLGIGNYTLYTPDTQLGISLYVGIYNVTIIRDGFQPLTITLNLTGDLDLQPLLQSILYNVNLTFIDPTLNLPGGVIPISNQLPLSLTIISWNGIQLGVSARLTDQAVLTLPPGYYVLNASLEGYQPILIDLEVEEDTQYTALVDPITVAVTIDLTAVDSSTGEELGPINQGNLTLVYTPLPLTTNTTVEVNFGTVSTDLRPGVYTAIYSYMDLVLQAQFQVPEQVDTAEVRVEFTVPRMEFLFTVSDAESSLYDVNATVELHYLGPFGNVEDAVFSVSTRQGAVSLRLLPGVYELTAMAKYYVNTTLSPVYLLSPNTTVNIQMEPIKYYVTFDVRTPEGDPVARARLTLVNLDTGETVTTSVIDGTASITDGLRAGRYSASIMPEAYYLRESTITVTIPDNLTGASIIPVTLNYTMFNITIELRDSQTGNLIGLSYLVKYVREGNLECANCSGSFNVSGKGSIILPYGTYKLTFSPLTMDVYTFPDEVTIEADANKTVPVTADPKIYTVVVTVTNDLGEPLKGALVTIVDSNGIIRFGGLTTDDGTIEAQLTYGAYQVVVDANGYHQLQKTITVPDQTNVPLSLQPTLTTKLKRMTPIFVGMAGLIIFGIAFYRISRRIMGRMEEEYF